jgi:hypothetical protein
MAGINPLFGFLLYVYRPGTTLMKTISCRTLRGLTLACYGPAITPSLAASGFTRI